ncbi:MAG: tyrosine-type recombinase/integrase, partial [Ilumatobacteraceae bacterium]|nr:tyrosine-type recombinase/integrase [Ilumatobacteraceae bacterium]
MTDQELFDAFEEYQRGRGLAQSTRERRRMSLRSLTRYMTPRSITTVKVPDVDGWLARLKTPGTKTAYYRDLVAFYKWAHRRELIAANPMLLTDPPRAPKHLPKPCKAEVIGTAVAMSNGPTQLMILLGALAGLRVAEIAALSSEDIFLDHEPPVLLVRQGKGGKDRIVPIHPTLLARLRNVDHGW